MSPFHPLFLETMKSGSFIMILYLKWENVSNQVVTQVLLVSFCYLVLRQVNGLYMIYGKDHGKEGLLQVGGNLNDTKLYDQQLWRILKSHSSYLELTPTSIYDQEIISVNILILCYF